MEQETKVFRRGGSRALHIPANVRIRSGVVRIQETPTGFLVVDPELEAEILGELEDMASKAARRAKRKPAVRA